MSTSTALGALKLSVQPVKHWDQLDVIGESHEGGATACNNYAVSKYSV